MKKGRKLNSESVKVEDDGAVMRIRDSKMAEFFKPAVEEITKLLRKHLQENESARPLDTIYWVGGFGGCKYLRSQLENAIEDKFQHCKYQFPVPPQPEFAVIRGATAFRCDRSIVKKRKTDATYGALYFQAEDETSFVDFLLSGE